MKYALGNMLNGAGVRGLDADAKAYIDAVVAAGATVTATQRNAINAFVKSGKTAGWWASMKRIYLPIWSIAQPNAIDMVGRTSGTFAGTVTHASGYIQGDGSTGVFRSNGTPNSLGLTSGSGFLFTLCNQSQTSTGAAIGCLQGTTNRCSIASTTSLSIQAEYIAGGAAAANASLSLANQNGVLCFSRTSTTSLTLYQRKTSGFSTLATNTTLETLTAPTESVCVMARGRTSTTQDLYTNGRHGSFGIGLGMSQADVSIFTASLKTLWETCTGLTLP